MTAIPAIRQSDPIAAAINAAARSAGGKMQRYENGKRLLAAMNLTASEYERAIARLVAKLKI